MPIIKKQICNCQKYATYIGLGLRKIKVELIEIFWCSQCGGIRKGCDTGEKIYWIDKKWKLPKNRRLNNAILQPTIK